jgi:hypothetical protein
MGLNNRDFLECAYSTILNRDADEAGLAHYTERLRAGHPRLAILSTLYTSAEARAASVRIPWLSRAIFLYKFTDLPVLRLIRRASEGRDWRFEFEHRLSVVENSVAALGSASATQHGNLAELVATLRMIANQAKAGASDLSETNPDVDLSSQTLVAKRIHKELLDAIESARNSGLDFN